MVKEEIDLLKQIKDTVLQQDSSAKIYLYGSRARGTASDNSDWDLLILVDKDEISLEEQQNITFPLYDIEFETGEIISPMVYTEQEWHSKYKVTPFFKNVMGEGKQL